MAQTTGGERWIRIDTTEETNEGVANSSPTWRGVRAVGGAIGLAPGKQTIDIEEEANVTTQPAPLLSHFAPGGTVGVIPSCHDTTTTFGSGTDGFFRWLLDWFFTRTSGILASHSIEVANPSILTEQYLGCKPAELSIGWSENGGKLDVGVTINAQNVGRRATALTTAVAASVTFPSSRDWIVSQIGLQIGADLTVTSSNRTVTALQLSLSNNLTPGAPTYFYPSNGDPQETRRNGLSELREGELSLSGSISFLLEDDTWFDRYMEDDSTDKRGALRLLAFHPDSTRTTMVGAETTDGVDNEILVASGTGFAAGDVVYLEDASAADPTTWDKEVLELSSVVTNTLTVITNGSDDNGESNGRSQAFAAGSFVYSKGLQIRVPQFQITDIQRTGGARDKVGVTVSFIGEIASGETQVLGYLLK